MLISRFRRASLSALLLLSVLLFPSLCSAAETPPTLTVSAAGAYLYARPEDQADIVARVEQGEALTPIGQAIGRGTWYMVATQKGAVGWIRSSDVKASGGLEKAFRETPASTWSATTSNGRSFAGTWTGEADSSGSAASGSWTLEDGAGNIVLSGTWSATKSPKGWSGAWRAFVTGGKGEYAGTWSANVRLKPNGGFAELFEAAVQEAVGGGWRTGPYSGSWSIRAAAK